MSPSFKIKYQIDLLHFQKSDSTIFWINFYFEKSKQQILREKPAIFMLYLFTIILCIEQKFSYGRLNLGIFLDSTSLSAIQHLERGIVTGFGPET